MADPTPASTTTRRGLLKLGALTGLVSWLSAGWGLFAGACATGAGALGRFMMPAVLFEPPQQFKAGLPSSFEPGVSENFKAKFSTWIVRNKEGFYALSTTCTHLGCTPNYLSAEGKFKCPCHGSGFYKTGMNFEGPAPRPLERYRIALADDGQILIDKTKIYAYEKGEWENPESFMRA